MKVERVGDIAELAVCYDHDKPGSNFYALMYLYGKTYFYTLPIIEEEQGRIYIPKQKIEEIEWKEATGPDIWRKNSIMLSRWAQNIEVNTGAEVAHVFFSDDGLELKKIHRSKGVGTDE